MFGWLNKILPQTRARQDANWWDNWAAETSDTAAPGAHRIRSPRQALTYAPVWQAVSLISGDVADFPVVVTDESRDPENAKKDHPAYFLLRRSPSPAMSANKFWRRFVAQLLLWNNAYAEIVRDARFRPIELILIPTEFVSVDPDTGWYLVNRNSGMVRLAPSQMFAVEGLSLGSDTMAGGEIERLNLWKLAARSWGLGLSAEAFAAIFFERGAQNSGVLEVPASMSKDARDRLAQQVTKKYGGLENAFKVMVLRDGAKWTNTQVAPVDAELGPLRDAQVADVARWFNLPPEKLGLPVNVSYGSLIEQQKSYRTSTLAPILRSIQDEAWIKLLTTAEQRAEETFIVHDLDPLFAADADNPENQESTRQPRPNEQEPQTEEAEA